MSVQLWRKAFLLKYIGLPIPKKKKKKKKLNLRSTLVRLGEMVFVSFEVENMSSFLVQSIVRWGWVLVRSWGAVVSFPM